MRFHPSEALNRIIDRLSNCPPAEEDVERNMERFFRKRKLQGYITEDEIVRKVLRGWIKPIIIKDGGRLIVVIVNKHGKRFSLVVFRNGKSIRRPVAFTPAQLNRAVEDFVNRKKVESPRISKRLLGTHAIINNEGIATAITVTQLGNLCWWPNTDHSIVLAGGHLSNGKFVVLSYEDGEVLILRLDEPQAQLVLDNLSSVPRILHNGGELHIELNADQMLTVAYKNGWKWLRVEDNQGGRAMSEEDWYQSNAIIDAMPSNDDGLPWNEIFEKAF